jgi:zinc/manganese transport system permease protein
VNFLADWLIAPFAEYGFMRNALVACLCIAVSSAPMGVFLVLRRMSLVGDALSHAVLPGAAVGFLFGGLSVLAMGLGGFVAGLLVAVTAGVMTRVTAQYEDASFAVMYLVSLAAGVLIVSSGGSSVDLVHVLFGSILAVDRVSLLLVASIASVTLFTLALGYRVLVVECFDPEFLRSVGGPGGAAHLTFLVLIVLNLVAGFTALGTLMAVGLMMVPAIAARYWARQIWSMALAAAGMAALSGYFGLLVSYHADMPTGPSIILLAGALYMVSLAVGPQGGLMRRFGKKRHYIG